MTTKTTHRLANTAHFLLGLAAIKYMWSGDTLYDGICTVMVVLVLTFHAIKEL